MSFFYTAITHNETKEIRFAEHFTDKGEMLKRSKQLHIEAVKLGPWKCYAGSEPVEAFLVRLAAKPEGSEIIFETDDNEASSKKLEAFSARVDKEAAKAGAKTISVLTDPEIDDTQDARPLPDWAVAQHAMEAAAQALADAKQSAETLIKRAESMDDQANSTKADRGARNPALIAAADGARGEADSAKARLYHAEQDYAEKKDVFDRLFAEHQAESKTSAKEVHKK